MNAYFMFNLYCFLLSSSVSALSLNIAKDIRLRLSPLVGGPTWLPVHVKVILCDEYGFDFVPQNPTSVETLGKLLTFQTVPADARILPSKRSNRKDADSYVMRAQEFCTEYDKDLHLLNNNCWTFAFEIVNYVKKEG
jgi:hypothetical protein